MNSVARAAIVIPSHKAALSPLEIISVRRAASVFCGHDMWLAAPAGMDVSRWSQWAPGIQVAWFDPYYFSSPRGYNHLCRTEEFYSRFKQYDYFLIYQTDCYVFRNELQSWCDRGYDYIGAPWLNYEFRKFSKKRWTQYRGFRPFLRRVGNGGFSLRRVVAMQRACRLLRYFINHMLDIPEDVFWCNFARYIYPLRIPGWREALGFAFDAAPAECLSKNGGQLPFGCHAWHTDSQAFWKEHIPVNEQNCV